MKQTFFLKFLFIFIAVSAIHASDPYTLSLQDVRPSMEKIFSYHVENKEFSPLVVKRSFKIYIEQFDPNRLYLLKAEIEPFLALSQSKVQKVIHDFQHDQYPEYWNLNSLLERSIHRSQKIRYEEIERLTYEKLEELEAPTLTSYSSYSANEQELRKRIRDQLILELKSSTKKRKVTSLSPQLIQKILDHYSNRLRSFESQYAQSTEHCLALHMLKALAKSLDAHTGYYSPREAYEIRTALKKEFSGVGVILRDDFDGVYISELIKGGPAEKSGKVQSGDILVAIDQQDVERLSFEKLLELMKGKSGSKVTLDLKRDEKVIRVDLTREKVIMDEERLFVEYVPNGDGIIGKICVPSFYDNGRAISLDRDLRDALRTLKQKGNLQGIIMDFRENSGGFLTQAVKVSSLFIQSGLVVISKYADGEVNYQKNIDGRHYFDGPLIILTSKASASAAEIVAQALQDYGVALVIGDERSYGKGSMQYQTITDERARAFFKVTVGRYYTASGRSPQIQGVQADIVVPTAFFPYKIGERYLEFPLSSDYLSGDVLHSLTSAKKGSYKDIAHFIVPYLQPRESTWRRMLPRLKINSQKRIEQNQNFQFFLKVGHGYQPKKSKSKSHFATQDENFGSSDLQMNEAVEIVKDMIIITKENLLR